MASGSVFAVAQRAGAAGIGAKGATAIFTDRELTIENEGE